MKQVWMLFLLAAVCFTGKSVESQDALPQFSIKVVVDTEKVEVDTADKEDSQGQDIKEHIQASMEHRLGKLADFEKRLILPP